MSTPDTRLRFPEDRMTFQYGAPGEPIRTAPRTGVKVFLDEACTTPADILTTVGTPIPYSTIYTQDDSLLPEFLGPPEYVTRLWARVVGVTADAYPLVAQYSEQLGLLPTLLSGDGPPTADLGVLGSVYLDLGIRPDPNVPDDPRLYGPKTLVGWPTSGTALVGPKGDPAAVLVWNQVSPDTEWQITHDLTHLPSVTLIDSAGEEFFADVVYPPGQPQIVIVRIGAPESGTALLK